MKSDGAQTNRVGLWTFHFIPFMKLWLRRSHEYKQSTIARSVAIRFMFEWTWTWTCHPVCPFLFKLLLIMDYERSQSFSSKFLVKYLQRSSFSFSTELIYGCSFIVECHAIGTAHPVSKRPSTNKNWPGRITSTPKTQRMRTGRMPRLDSGAQLISNKQFRSNANCGVCRRRRPAQLPPKNMPYAHGSDRLRLWLTNRSDWLPPDHWSRMRSISFQFFF